tara:strand:+ start:77 stop:712 length:636 start_codon:yes stop_codon:yes gene_type:complete
MKNIIKNMFLRLLNLKLTIRELDEILIWQNIYNFEEPFPHFIKKRVLQKYSSKNTIWVETGTYRGETSDFLSKISKFVFTIEPSEKYFKYSKDALSEVANLKILNGTSEEYLNEILSDIDEDSIVSFWLDGHWSGEDTFKGENDTPIEYELEIISKYLKKFIKTTVLIDDFRLFGKNSEKKEVYPEKKYLINWAKENNLNWEITRDIFIAS